MNRAFKLFRLQQVDTQLDQVRGRLAEIQRILADDQTIQAAKLAREEAWANAQAANSALRSAEEDVKAHQMHIEQNQASLYGGKITNPKELQDLQKEAEVLARKLEGLEDVQLNKMSDLEEKQAELAKVNEVLEGLIAQQAVEQRALHSEHSKMLEESQRMEHEREAALTGINQPELDVYETLRKSKAGLAVSKVEARTCSACGAELSAAMVAASKAPEDLVRCENCRRILYSG